MNDLHDRHYEGIDHLEVMTEARRYNHFLSNMVVAEAGGRGPVVDFGAGTGLLAEMVAATGITVLCIEPDPTLRQRLRAKSLDAYATLDALPAKAVPYAYSFNVLEHIDDDVEACRAIYSILAPGGRFLVYVPAFQVLYSTMDRKVGHVRRYTRQGLVDVLRLAGFIVNRSEYVDSLGFFAALGFKYLGNANGNIKPTSVSWYDRFAFPLSRRGDRLFHRLFGKNVLAMAERPPAELERG